MSEIWNYRWMVKVYRVALFGLPVYEAEKHFLTYDGAKAYYDEQEPTMEIPFCNPRVELIEVRFREGEHKEYVLERKGYA